MSIFDIRNKVELEQYTVKQAMITAKTVIDNTYTADEEISVMLDVVFALLNQSYTGLDSVVASMTEYGRVQRKPRRIYRKREVTA